MLLIMWFCWFDAVLLLFVWSYRWIYPRCSGSAGSSVSAIVFYIKAGEQKIHSWCNQPRAEFIFYFRVSSIAKAKNTNIHTESTPQTHRDSHAQRTACEGACERCLGDISGFWKNIQIHWHDAGQCMWGSRQVNNGGNLSLGIISFVKHPPWNRSCA